MKFMWKNVGELNETKQIIHLAQSLGHRSSQRMVTALCRRGSKGWWELREQTIGQSKNQGQLSPLNAGLRALSWMLLFSIRDRTAALGCCLALLPCWNTTGIRNHFDHSAPTFGHSVFTCTLSHSWSARTCLWNSSFYNS